MQQIVPIKDHPEMQENLGLDPEKHVIVTKDAYERAKRLENKILTELEAWLGI